MRFLPVFACLVLAGCSKPVNLADLPTACLNAVHSALGPNAEVLRCGELTVTGATEAIGIIRINQPGRTAATRGVVLRLESGSWRNVLQLNQQVSNDAGYVGAEYIDDCEEMQGFIVSEDRGATGLQLDITYLNGASEPEGLPLRVGWNTEAGRWQEYSSEGHFLPETKNPPHVRLCEKPE